MHAISNTHIQFTYTHIYTFMRNQIYILNIGLITYAIKREQVSVIIAVTADYILAVML